MLNLGDASLSRPAVTAAEQPTTIQASLCCAPSGRSRRGIGNELGQPMPVPLA